MKLRAIILAILIVGICFASVSAPASAGKKDDPCKGKNKKNCEVPEVPWTLILPTASVAIAASYYLVQRRRFRDDTTDEQP